MIFALLTLLAALSLAAVAGWFSIVGFMTIYAGAPMYALIMGIVTECAKLVTTSWLYRNWSHASWKLKAPLIYFTVALMVATSIGVYGFLSKAHLEQGASTLDNSSKIEQLTYRVDREKSSIVDNEKVTKQLDDTVNSLLGKDRADRALSVRKSQANQRKQLRDDSASAQKRIDELNAEKFKLESEIRKLQLEVGPIRYIAELFYGADDNTNKNIEAAIRIFTLLLVSTLDPLAVVLLVAANHTFLRLRNEKTEENKTLKSGLFDRFRKKKNSNEEMGQTNAEPTGEYPDIFEEIIPPTSSGIEKASVASSTLQETMELLNEKEIIDTGNKGVTQTQTTDGNEENNFLSVESISRSKDVKDMGLSGLAASPADSIDGTTLYPTIFEGAEILRNKSVENFSVPETYISLPVIRSPILSRVGDTIEDSATKTIDQAVTTTRVPWAHQDAVLRELLGAVPHFAPQKINEEEKVILPSGEEAGHGVQATNPPQPQEKIDEMYQEKSTIDTTPSSSTDIRKESVYPANDDKYPKALSWLTEFRRL